jgi:hypothetical protein
MDNAGEASTSGKQPPGTFPPPDPELAVVEGAATEIAGDDSDGATAEKAQYPRGGRLARIDSGPQEGMYAVNDGWQLGDAPISHRDPVGRR